MHERLLFVCPDLDYALRFDDMLRRQAKSSPVHILTDRPSTLEANARFRALSIKNPNVTFSMRPPPHDHGHRVLGDILRGCMQAWRLLETTDDVAALTRYLAEHRVPVPPIALRSRFVRARRVRDRLAAIARAIERSLPLDPALVGLLEKIRPDVVIITPIAGFGISAADYVRAAQRLDIRTLGVAGDWDEFNARGLVHQPPDCIGVWNAAQRRELANEHDYSPHQVAVIGAPGMQPCVEPPQLTRDGFCALHELDPVRPILAVALPADAGADAALRRFERWLRAVRVHAPMRGASIVVCSPSAEPAVGSEAPFFDGGVVVPSRVDLSEVLHHAASLVTFDMTGVLRAAAVGRRVFAYADAGLGLYADELRRFTERAAVESSWLHRTTDLEQHCAALAAEFTLPLTRRAQAAARNLVRPHGAEITPSLLLSMRVVPLLMRQHPPVPKRHTAWFWQRWLAGALAGPARRAVPPPVDGPVRVLVAAHSTADVEAHSAVLETLAAQGHDVAVVLTAAAGAPADSEPPAINVHRVRFAGAVAARSDAWAPLARFTRSLSTFLRLTHSGIIEHNLSNTQYLQLAMPAGFRGIAQWVRRSLNVRRTVRLLRHVERVMTPAREARALMDREQPALLLVLSPLDAVGVFDSASAQTDLIVYAKRCGIPTVATVGTSDVPVNAGLLHAAPDVVAVWNEVQRAASIKYAPPSTRVVVTGPAAVEPYLRGKAVMTRSAFCEAFRLPKKRPFILFAGANGVPVSAAEERRFADKLIKTKRRSENAALRRAPVMIRPAPGAAASWAAADFARLGHVIVCPTEYDAWGALDRVLLTESIRYATAVVSGNPLVLMLASALRRPAIGIATGRSSRAGSKVGLAGEVKWVYDAADAVSAIRELVQAEVDHADAAPFTGADASAGVDVEMAAASRLAAVVAEAGSAGRMWRTRATMGALAVRPLMLLASGGLAVVAAGATLASQVRARMGVLRTGAKRRSKTVRIEPEVDLASARGPMSNG